MLVVLFASHRATRLTLKLFQRQVAEQLRVNAASIRNWEMNITHPSLEFMPGIIWFLGYNYTCL